MPSRNGFRSPWISCPVPASTPCLVSLLASPATPSPDSQRQPQASRPKRWVNPLCCAACGLRVCCVVLCCVVLCCVCSVRCVFVFRVQCTMFHVIQERSPFLPHVCCCCTPHRRIYACHVCTARLQAKSYAKLRALRPVNDRLHEYRKLLRVAASMLAAILHAQA